MSLVEAGIGGATIYALYEPLAKKDSTNVSSIIITAQKLYYQSGSLFVVLLILMSIGYPIFLDTGVMTKSQITLFVLILGVAKIVDFFVVSKYLVLLTADKKLHIISMAGLTFTFFNAMIIIYLATIEMSVIVAKGAAIIAVVLQALILVKYCKLTYSYIDYKARTSESKVPKRWTVLSIQILTGLHHGLPVVLITLFITLSELSVYSIYSLLFLAVGGIVSIFSNALVPFFGELLVLKDDDKFQKAYGQFESFHFIMLAIAYCCTVFLVDPFIDLYTHDIKDADYDRPLLTVLFIIMGITNYIKSPAGVLMQSSGRFTVTRNQWIVQTLVALVLGIFFVQSWGLIGVLMAMIASNLYRDFALISYVSSRYSGVSLSKTLKNIAVCLFCLCSAFLLESWVAISIISYTSYFVISLIVGMCVLISVFLIFFLTSKSEVSALIRNFLRLFSDNINLKKG
ncbi:hypothetical protein OA101_00130 [Alphaproteobacteria bacterium]|nr:hypothetical protein [Alphaproteobacteria bacterium]